MNLGGFDAKEVPLAEQKEPSRSPPTLCQPITAFTSCFSLMASLQASPYSDSQPLSQPLRQAQAPYQAWVKPGPAGPQYLRRSPELLVSPPRPQDLLLKDPCP